MADVIEIGAEVRSRELRLTSIPMMPSGSRNHLRIRITFDAEWEGATKTLVAYRDLAHPYHVPLGLDGTALIPHEVLAEQGVAYLGVFGVAGDQRVTSTIVRYGVNEGALTEGLEPSDPTPEMWEQLISAVNEVRQAAESAMRDAQTAAQGAQQSEQAAAGSATQAQESARSAGNSAASAEQAQQGATDAETAARQSAAQAQKSQETATQAATEAGGFARQAAGAQTAAQNSARSAGEQANAAATSARQAQQSQTAAAGSATSAQASATEAAKRATVAEASAVRAEKSAEDAKTAAERAATMIDDISIVRDRTWSSRNIVDMLCPPISESGNHVVCYPVVGYPLSATASWEPYQDGVGDPSTDNIRPIHGRDSVVVRRLGHNLVDLPDTTVTSYNEILKLTPEQLSQFNALPRGVPLWFYADIDGFSNGELVCVGKSGTLGYIRKNGSGKLNAGEITQVRIVGGASAAGERHYKNLMVGLHSDLTYQPYTAQINTIALPKTIYGGEVDAVTGDGNETWVLMTLDGTENWYTLPDSAHKFYSKWKRVWGKTDVPSAAFCSIVKYSGRRDIKNNGDFAMVGFVDSEGWIGVMLESFTLETWKAYLAEQFTAGSPVTIAYKNNQITAFTATGNAPITALDGTNTIMTDADSVTVTGRADPTAYYGKKIAEISAAIVAR